MYYFSNIVEDKFFVSVNLYHLRYLNILLELFERKNKRLLIKEIRFQDDSNKFSHLGILVELVLVACMVKEL